MTATGLGPCLEPWWVSCNYGIRVEGPGGYDHRGNFLWEQGQAAAGQPGHGLNGPVQSIGTYGDLPPILPPGRWSISFRLWYGSDAIRLNPVPNGTPRLGEEDPFLAACSTNLETGGVESVLLHVEFKGGSCSVETVSGPGIPDVVGGTE